MCENCTLSSTFLLQKNETLKFQIEKGSCRDFHDIWTTKFVREESFAAYLI